MLTLIQPEFEWSFMAWVSYVPFIYTAIKGDKSRQRYLWAMLVGTVYWLASLYWMVPVTVAGWIAFSIYTALLWPLLVWVLRLAVKNRIPIILASAVLIVAAENLQGIFFKGFYWRFLAHSQYSNLHLIQFADILGAGGVSFIIALVNGLLADLWLNFEQNNRVFRQAGTYAKIAGTAIILIGVLIYGHWRLGQNTTVAGPVVASIQTNVPQSVKESRKAEAQILAELLEMTRESLKADPALVVWPETMVQGIIDDRILRYLSEFHQYRIFDRMIKEMAENNSYILVGSTGATPEFRDNGNLTTRKRFNTAFLYTPVGEKADVQYNKIHLVPFGETVPFKQSFPPLYNLLMLFSPYDYDYTLDPGNEYTVFRIGPYRDLLQNQYRFGVLICYEDMVPKIARKFVTSRDGRKNVDWLINISNDGWFVRFKGDEVLPSHELMQHTATSVFRAVENRVSVVRSVNTGISCIIDPNGSIRDGYINGTLPENAKDRKAVAGWFADRVLIDSRKTIFSRLGRLFSKFCIILLFIPIIKEGTINFAKRKKKWKKDQ